MNKTPEYLRPINHKELVQKYRLYKEDFKYNESVDIPRKERNRVSAGLEVYQGEWSDQNIGHLLKRTLFSPTKRDLTLLRDKNLAESVAELLKPVALLNPPINNYNPSSEIGDDPNTPFGETWVEAPFDNDFESFKILSLKGWITKNLIEAPTSLHHKMTFFWHNLLVTQFWDVFQAKASYQYYRLLHDHAFGNFKTLIKEVTKNPAMLIYLNGTRNNKEAPDENYARELQELFCVGKGPNSNYTENDVQAAARILTGWVIDFDSFTEIGETRSLFFPEIHDEGDKNFSEFYGNRIVSGKGGQDGEQELDELLDIIFDNEETALYICRRLYNFFVFNEVDAETEENIIKPLAQLFRENDFEILPVLETLLESAHFHDENNHGVLIKNSLEHLLGLVKTLDLQLFDPNEINEEYQTLNSVIYNSSILGLELGDPPSVAGWPAYYQEPQFDRSWITTDSITRRAQASDTVVQFAFYVSSELFFETDLVKWIETFDNPLDPNDLLNEAGVLLHGIPLGENSFKMIKSILLGGQEGDYHWTQAWNSYVTQPDDEQLRSAVENRLKATFAAFMQQGEYHLM